MPLTPEEEKKWLDGTAAAEDWKDIRRKERERKKRREKERQEKAKEKDER